MMIRELPLLDVWKLTWLYIAALLIGLVMRFAWSWERGQYSAHYFGDAFIAIGILGLIFELALKRHLLVETAEYLSDRLAARHLPAQLQKLILDVAFRTDLVRHDYQMRYRISDSQESGAVDIELDISYDVRNYGPSAVPYRPFCSEDIMYRPAFRLLECSAGPQSYVWDQTCITSAEVTKGQSRSVTGDEVVLSPGETCSVHWKYTMRAPREYMHLQVFGGATINAEIQLDDIPSHLDFQATEESNGAAIRVPGGSRWTYRRAFISKQHLRVWWYPRTIPTRAQGPIPASSQEPASKA